MGNEWGPWVEHDGMGCPCVGMITQWEFDADLIYKVGAVDIHGNEIIGPRTAQGRPENGEAWSWTAGYYRVIRYRIRKPKGMTILEQLVKNPERELEDV